jgi:hypothetical protein
VTVRTRRVVLAHLSHKVDRERFLFRRTPQTS